jgi:hypothetical protein
MPVKLWAGIGSNRLRPGHGLRCERSLLSDKMQLERLSGVVKSLAFRSDELRAAGI